MARGKRVDAETKEKARHMLATGAASSDVAKELGLPLGTVSSWLCKWHDDTEFKKLQQEKKESFAQKAEEICDIGQTLLLRRLKRALEQEDEIDDLVEIVKDSALDGKQKLALLGRLRAISVDDVKSIGVVIGTMFDKLQLSLGNPTENVSIKRFEDFLDLGVENDK